MGLGEKGWGSQDEDGDGRAAVEGPGSSEDRNRVVEDCESKVLGSESVPLLQNVSVQTPGEEPWAIWRQALPRRAERSQVSTFCLHSYCSSQKEGDWLLGSHKAEWSGTRIPDARSLPPLSYITSRLIFSLKNNNNNNKPSLFAGVWLRKA